MNRDRSSVPTTPPAAAGTGLRARKQKRTRSTILDAAIDLFAEKGFDETTIDEIAERAFVSRRSFFRYFESKSDLMGQPVVNMADALKQAVDACPRHAGKAELFRFVVCALTRESAAEPRTTKVLEIAAKCPAARQALMASMANVQNRIEDAFKGRFKDPLTAQVLSSLAVSALGLATRHWFETGVKDIDSSTRKVFSAFADVTGAADQRRK